MPVQNTQRNRERRIAKHNKMYPQRDTRSAATRRAIGKAWKMEAARREKLHTQVASEAYEFAAATRATVETLNKAQ